MTLATQLTLLRIPLAFLIMGLLYLPGWMPKAAALGCFLLAALTDWLDGFLARQWNQTSALGALLDPLTDKILVLGLFLVFVQLGVAPAWMVLLIILRESVITGVRMLAASRHVVLPAAKEGKQKMVSQLVAIFVILVALLLRALAMRELVSLHVEELMDDLRMVSLWVTTLLTVSSGILFFYTHRAVLLDGGTPRR